MLSLLAFLHLDHYWIATWGAWLVVVSLLSAPFWFNPQTFDGKNVVVRGRHSRCASARCRRCFAAEQRTDLPLSDAASFSCVSGFVPLTGAASSVPGGLHGVAGVDARQLRRRRQVHVGVLEPRAGAARPQHAAGPGKSCSHASSPPCCMMPARASPGSAGATASVATLSGRSRARSASRQDHVSKVVACGRTRRET